MRTLNDLNLKAKDKAKVRIWLMEIIKHYKKMSDGDRETVHRFDMGNLDFFYFTDCRDILSKNPESKRAEDIESIKKRKKAIEYKLIFETLLGKKLGKKRPCSHCGNDDRIIDSLGNNAGHFLFCEKCGMTTIVTYPIDYKTCIETMMTRLRVKNKVKFQKFLPIQKEEKHECCGKCKNKNYLNLRE